MSNPRHPNFKRATPVDSEQEAFPPCPELRDVRLTRPPMTEEEAAMNWAAMNAGHSEGLAGSGGMLPERLDSGGWPILEGSITRTGHYPSARGQLPNMGYPVAGSTLASTPIYPSSWGYATNPTYPLDAGQPPYRSPQEGSRPRSSGYSQGEGYTRADSRAARGRRS